MGEGRDITVITSRGHERLPREANTINHLLEQIRVFRKVAEHRVNLKKLCTSSPKKC